MKKILSFLFIGLLAFILIGCGEEEKLSLTINDADKNITLEVDATKQINVSFEGEGVVWSVDNAEIVSVNDGLITALKDGLAVVTVTLKGHEDYKATITVTVNKKVVDVTNIAVGGKRTEAMVGDEFNLTAIVTPSNATDKTITWASSDPTVAALTPNGDTCKVKALKVGTVEISATAGSKTEKFTLTVSEAKVLAKDLYLEEGKQIFHIGETDQGYAEIDDEANN